MNVEFRLIIEKNFDTMEKNYGTILKTMEL